MPKEEREQIDEEYEDEGINLHKYFIVLLNHKKLIMLITLPLAGILIILSLQSAFFFYESHISILPPQKQDAGISNELLRGLGIFPGRTGKTKTIQIMVEIIQSRTFMTKIIKRFGMERSYGAEDLREARSMFEDRIRITPSFDPVKSRLSPKYRNSPLLRIRVADQSAQKAAEIANAIVEELQMTLNEMDISEASHRKMSFEKQLKTTFEALSKAEEEMKAFQEKNGIFELQDKMNIAINKFAPALMMDYKRILRQLKFDETLYGIMVKQYEAARMDSVQNVRYIQIIDKAIPALKPRSMRSLGLKRALGIIVLIFVFSCIFVLIRDYTRRRKTLS